ncbi:predicted protein [Naegleria gruberi]|uniref:Predicted protein n=1 Tax=Naegleria gruberi TaxID=5762 RepID=D2VK17_NAEGR|nr:uncharacterized protein NAEGRDRAFT_69237 [Naegleria gruberi]EFC42871.1 predicted protein [Naegleria gruberi]|eukprot:XP_002675615.1 predicted protein [Naegleria gruberi strain NEG-M]
MAVYATHNVFLVLADMFLIILGTFGLLVGFEIASLKDKAKTTSFLHSGCTLFLIPTILFIVSTQGAIEFSLWEFYQTVLPYKLKSIMSSTTSVTTTMVNTFTYLDPTFAFIFALILGVVWIISLIGSLSFLKSANGALFDGTGAPLRNVSSTIESNASASTVVDTVDKTSTVSYVAYTAPNQ